jgi:hypothetical protein
MRHTFGYQLLVVRLDGAGTSKALLTHIRSLRDTTVHAEFSVGWAVGGRKHTAIATLPERTCTPAVRFDGDRPWRGDRRADRAAREAALRLRAAWARSRPMVRDQRHLPELRAIRDRPHHLNPG